MLINKRNVHTKNESSILYKSRFPLKLTYRQTDIHTERRTDISVCRVVSLLKKDKYKFYKTGLGLSIGLLLLELPFICLFVCIQCASIVLFTIKIQGPSISKL